MPGGDMMSDPPVSHRRPRPADNTWYDHDMSRQCARCKRQGLYRTNKSGLCRTCIASAPKVLSLGMTRMSDLERAHARAVLGYYADGDRDSAAQILGIPRPRLDAILAGGNRTLAGAPVE